MKNKILISTLLTLIISCSSKHSTGDISDVPQDENPGVPASKIPEQKTILSSENIASIRANLNKWVTVRGRVYEVFAPPTSKAIFINFSHFRDNGFAAVVFTSNLGNWPGGRTYFQSLAGKMVAVEGPIKEYKGRIEIIVNSPSQLTIE
jgi:DNA/RNA endonuclease YhcR with UshA esterase domain